MEHLLVSRMGTMSDLRWGMRLEQGMGLQLVME
jgi:hypothetical protein